MFFVHVFEHLAFSMKSGVEVKVVKLKTHVILYIYDGFHYSFVMAFFNPLKSKLYIQGKIFFKKNDGCVWKI